MTDEKEVKKHSKKGNKGNTGFSRYTFIIGGLKMCKFDKFKRKQKIKERQPKPLFRLDELVINTPVAPEQINFNKQRKV